MVSIGTLQFNDAWIKGKYSKTAAVLRKWNDNGSFAFNIPDITIDLIEQANSENVVQAIDGTKYVLNCAGLNSSPTYSIQASSTSAKVGDILLLSVQCSGGVMFYGIDNYGNRFNTVENTIFDVQISEDFNEYYLKYAFGYNGSIVQSGEISIPVSTENTNEKEVFINKCSTSQLQNLSSLVGTYQDISDTEVTFTNAFIKGIDAEFIADDMSDVAVKNAQSVDIYKVKVSFVVK